MIEKFNNRLFKFHLETVEMTKIAPSENPTIAKIFIVFWTVSRTCLSKIDLWKFCTKLFSFKNPHFWRHAENGKRKRRKAAPARARRVWRTPPAQVGARPRICQQGARKADPREDRAPARGDRRRNTGTNCHFRSFFCLPPSSKQLWSATWALYKQK